MVITEFREFRWETLSATEGSNWETAPPTSRRAPPTMMVRRSWHSARLRRLRQIHDEKTGRNRVLGPMAVFLRNACENRRDSSFNLIDEGAQNAHASVRTQTQSSVDDCH
jgi:hypothetical protein